MGRKSREKRERAAIKPDAQPVTAPEPSVVAPAAVEPSAVREPRVPRSARQRQNPRPVGARVARVAVDDETWAAFKEQCGPTPASIRLGKLVAAEVERRDGLPRRRTPWLPSRRSALT